MEGRYRTMTCSKQPQDGPTTCCLTDLPQDALLLVFDAVADPLHPATACHFMASCKAVLGAVRASGDSCSKAAGLPRASSALQLFRHWSERAAVLCEANGTTRAQLRTATEFYPRSHPSERFGPAVRDALSLCHLLACGSLRGLRDLDLGDMEWSRFVAKLHGSKDTVVLPILHALAGGALPQLRRLNLYRCSLGDGFFMALSATLAASPKRVLPALETLYLDANNITSQGACALAGALARGALPQLKELYLWNNDIDGAGVAALARVGREGRLQALEKLDLQGNDGISAASQEVLAAAVSDGAFPSLRELWLPAKAECEPEHARSVAACEARNVKVTLCFFTYCDGESEQDGMSEDELEEDGD